MDQLSKIVDRSGLGIHGLTGWYPLSKFLTYRVGRSNYQLGPP